MYIMEDFIRLSNRVLKPNQRLNSIHGKEKSAHTYYYAGGYELGKALMEEMTRPSALLTNSDINKASSGVTTSTTPGGLTTAQLLALSPEQRSDLYKQTKSQGSNQG
jgi:hypothetical protein